MTVFLAAPYSLIEDDLIVAVVEALNAIGYSTPSNENTVGALVQTVPADPLASPTRGATTSEAQIEVNFAAITDDGGSGITSYSLEMDSGSGFVSVVGDPVDSLVLTFTVTAGITSGSSYDFRYRVKNVHGWSVGYSPTITIIAGIVPT